MICSKCGSTENPFPNKGKQCRPCLNKVVYRFREKRYGPIRDYIMEAKCRPCADCGRSFPHYVMDFDHLPGADKKFILSRYKVETRTMQEVVEEIAKCEVVCANCHRVRTFER